jgi:hypothetical protein
LYEAMAACDGVAVFTNADRGHDDDLIEDFDDIVGLLDAGTVASTAPSKVDTADTAERSFEPDEMPEEAHLVELLQCMNRRPMVSKRRRLALLISAWDVVTGRASPDEWFDSNRPMLSQFLRSNEDFWDLRVYGVSAQGGALPASKQALQAHRKPSSRIIIAGAGAQPHDLSAPISWLIGT